MSKTILAIDPGTTESAYVRFDGKTLCEKGFISNEQMLDYLSIPPVQDYILVIEEVRSYGMPVGRETFDTVFWYGRFAQVWAARGGKFVFAGRKDVGLHLCNHPRANDSTIRQALIDRFGPPGTKKNQGFLYDVKSHERAALALAVYAFDTGLGQQQEAA